MRLASLPLLLPLHVSFLATLLAALCPAQTPTVSASGETMRIRSSSVTGSGSRFAITLVMDDDNGNRALPTSYRRWWHVQIGNLPATATTLDVRVTNAGYSDIILPVWSRSADGGRTFGAYERLPTSATPRRSGTTHSFSFVVPASVTTLRLAKFFPFTVSDRDRLITRVRNHRHVRSVTNLGTTAGGRSLPMLEVTNTAIADTHKHRVWIHAGAHPAETTSYFNVEGLLDWLLSGDARAELALRHVIFDIVPMANPDGVHAGNYRTNERSVNLETQWTAPYTSTQREVVAMRTQIERFMAGSNPIELLLNLHSTHNVAFPFHFRHVSNPNFNLSTNRSGVIPAVHQLEQKWIDAFRKESTFVRLGTTLNSTLGAPTRPFVESMMHDRWSIAPTWKGAKVMAITFEGTYGRGPDRTTWNTQGHWKQVGKEMGVAIAAFFGAQSGSSVIAYGGDCGAKIFGSFSTQPDRFHLGTTGNANDPLWLVFGATRRATPLPFSTCTLRTELGVLVGGLRYSSVGAFVQSYPVPNLPGFAFKVQCVAADRRSSTTKLYATPGLDVLYVK